MTNIIPFSGNSHKAPQEERLTAHEAPLRKYIIDENDISLAAIYPHAVRVHETLSNRVVPAQNVREISSHPQYQYAGIENNPSMAQVAREVINQMHGPIISEVENVQEAA